MRLLWIALLLALAASGCSRQESDWRRAAGADSVPAYRDYLERYPAGAHADEARRRIREMEDDAAWARAQRLGTPEALQRYLGAWPGGRHAAAARERLAGFVTGGAGSWSVQLGAWSSESLAREQAARIAAEPAGPLAGRALRVEGSAGVWRLRAGGFDEAAARRLCAELAARDQDCVPVAP